MALVDVVNVYHAYHQLDPVDVARLEVPVNGVHLKTLRGHAARVVGLALG